MTDLLAASAPLLAFVFAGLFSPGPNVVMLTASGARFGFRATLPHLLGVPVGTGILAAASALGVGAALLAAPGLKFAFQIIASAWILWLAWRTAMAGRAGRASDQGRPFTFVQAVLFQAVNPKIWAVTVWRHGPRRCGCLWFSPPSILAFACSGPRWGTNCRGI